MKLLIFQLYNSLNLEMFSQYEDWLKPDLSEQYAFIKGDNE